jgi:hypothetical protein
MDAHVLVRRGHDCRIRVLVLPEVDVASYELAPQSPSIAVGVEFRCQCCLREVHSPVHLGSLPKDTLEIGIVVEVRWEEVSVGEHSFEGVFVFQ